MSLKNNGLLCIRSTIQRSYPLIDMPILVTSMVIADKPSNSEKKLATGFLSQYQEFLLATKQQFMAISSPRGIVPPAAYYIFQAFLEKLNRFLQFHARDPMLEHTIQRLGTLAEDYSLLSRHERFDRLIDERYFIDSQPLRNKFLIFVDDIRITGNRTSSSHAEDHPGRLPLCSRYA